MRQIEPSLSLCAKPDVESVALERDAASVANDIRMLKRAPGQTRHIPGIPECGDRPIWILQPDNGTSFSLTWLMARKLDGDFMWCCVNQCRNEGDEMDAALEQCSAVAPPADNVRGEQTLHV